jgi:hypothetical protein
MNRFQSSSLAVALVAGLLMASGVAAFVLLDPPRTWDSAAQYIVDQNGSASVTDGDGGVSDVVSAINSNQAWNGAGSGSVVNARSGNTNGFSLGDGVPMLRFDDPIRVCNGSCLAATFTGFYSQRNDGSWRIDDADIVTNTRYDFTTPSEPDGCSSEFFIDGIMVHEIGHGLSLMLLLLPAVQMALQRGVQQLVGQLVDERLGARLRIQHNRAAPALPL